MSRTVGEGHIGVLVGGRDDCVALAPALSRYWWVRASWMTRTTIMAAAITN
jgi:hypothetical protein